MYSALGDGNQQDLNNDLECDQFLNTALQRFTCDLYYHFGAFLAPISVCIITGKHYTKNYSPKVNGKSDNRNCESAETGDNRVTQKKYSCLINCKMHNKERIFKTEKLSNYP